MDVICIIYNNNDDDYNNENKDNSSKVRSSDKKQGTMHEQGGCKRNCDDEAQLKKNAMANAMQQKLIMVFMFIYDKEIVIRRKSKEKLCI